MSASAPSSPVSRDIVVSGEEKLLKPDPALYYRALDRFGLRPGEALLVDDREINVAGALAIGMHGHLFADAAGLRARLEAERLLDSFRHSSEGWNPSGLRATRPPDGSQPSLG